MAWHFLKLAIPSCQQMANGLVNRNINGRLGNHTSLNFLIKNSVITSLDFPAPPYTSLRLHAPSCSSPHLHIFITTLNAQGAEYHPLPCRVRICLSKKKHAMKAGGRISLLSNKQTTSKLLGFDSEAIRNPEPGSRRDPGISWEKGVNSRGNQNFCLKRSQKVLPGSFKVRPLVGL